MITTFVIFILAAITGLLIYRDAKQLDPRASQAAEKANELFHGWTNRLPFRKSHKEIAQQLKTWVTLTSMTNGQAFETMPSAYYDFAGWAASLSDEALMDLTEDAAEFCSFLNFDLAWMFDPECDQELKDTIEHILRNFFLAYWKSQQSAALAVFKQWQDTPDKRKDKVFSMKLFAALVEEGLALSPPDLILAADNERLAHIVDSINTAALDNNDLFKPILFDVVASYYEQEEIEVFEPGQVEIVEDGTQSDEVL